MKNKKLQNQNGQSERYGKENSEAIENMINAKRKFEEIDAVQEEHEKVKFKYTKKMKQLEEEVKQLQEEMNNLNKLIENEDKEIHKQEKEKINVGEFLINKHVRETIINELEGKELVPSFKVENLKKLNDKIDNVKVESVDYVSFIELGDRLICDAKINKPEIKFSKKKENFFLRKLKATLSFPEIVKEGYHKGDDK